MSHLRTVHGVDDIHAQRGLWIRAVGESGYFEVYRDDRWLASCLGLEFAEFMCAALEGDERMCAMLDAMGKAERA